MTFDVYQKYGVTLSRLQHSEIEMLRQWRNDHKISQYMGTQQYIAKEAQEAFRLSNEDNNIIYNNVINILKENYHLKITNLEKLTVEKIFKN